MAALHESNLTSLKLLHRGKVRDLYEVDDQHLLIVQTDRLSAFDVILPDPIPGKGEVLTAVSNFWFNYLGQVIPNHLSGIDPESVVATDADKAQVRGRSFVTKKLKPLPIEAIVRGYLVGSGWKDYKKLARSAGCRCPPDCKKRKNYLSHYLPHRPKLQSAITTKIFLSNRLKNYWAMLVLKR